MRKGANSLTKLKLMMRHLLGYKSNLCIGFEDQLTDFKSQ